LINGLNDNIVPIDHVSPYFQKADSLGEEIEFIEIPDAGHFEVIDSGSIAWPSILQAFEELLN